MAIMQVLLAGAELPPPSFEYLVVAGGGATGGTGGYSIVASVAGGGGGGFLESSMTNSYPSYTVTVGAAGLYVGQSGSNSSIASGSTLLVNAVGGGHGSTLDGGNGASGGSGGGGFGMYVANFNGMGGAGTAGQGNKGGDGWRDLAYGDWTAYGGGGGGAGGPGTDRTPTGGARKASTILTSALSATFANGFSGGGRTYTTQPGDQGRSGIVAIRYSLEYAAAVVTGNPSEYITATHRIYVWYGAGSFAF